jgi:hypothetical protein
MTKLVLFLAATVILASFSALPTLGAGADEEKKAANRAETLRLIRDPEPEFRNSSWYDTIDQVRRKETAKFIKHSKTEMNLAVNPPKPFPANNLYFRDELIGKPVTILYEFDLMCGQLIKASYVFDEVISWHEFETLKVALSKKYKLEPSVSSFPHQNKEFASFNLDDRSITLSKLGGLHIMPNRTWIKFQTSTWSWLAGGWLAPEYEPTCEAKQKFEKSLQKKL